MSCTRAGKFTGDICGWRGKEREIPQFDSILGHVCLVDERKQEGSRVVLSSKRTSDYWCFHKVVVFKVIFNEGCLSAQFNNVTSVFGKYHIPSKSPHPGSPGQEMLLTDVETRQREKYFGLCL